MHKLKFRIFTLLGACFLALSPATFATAGPLDLTTSTVGYIAVALFILAYIFVMMEEKIHLPKSKPVLVAAGIIWIILGAVYANAGLSKEAEAAFSETLLEYSELLLFLLVAMTYINALEERRMFDALRAWMVRKGFNYKALFWLTGFLAFFISSFANNLTTAMLMCAVVLKVAGDDSRFINLCCINIVVASNAGGAFSPFGDITTLMVWQGGEVDFFEFLDLFIPALVNFAVPALIMAFFIENRKPSAVLEDVELKRGALRILTLFVLTIITAVLCHLVLDLPPVLGMMMGLGYLQFFGYFLQRTLPGSLARKRALAERKGDQAMLERLGSVVPFNVFDPIARSEWDTLLFFYGVVMCVGGLGYMGYLASLSGALYGHLDPTVANTILGIISSVVDNIPVMYAVLTMHPDMAHGQWLLITLTAGVGGSLLALGSAAGVALMGQARGHYSFMSHLKWSPVVALGFAASILVHLWVNASLF